jgi:hypothetical protein
MTRRLVACATLSVLCAVPVASHAADEVPVPPDAEFLEYLGSWDGDDEDWLVAASPLAAAPVDAGRPARTIESSGDGDVPPPQEQKR